jgi:large conductance mechanosensitive channel
MGFIQEFKEFALKGNVVDMAVGIIIGAAFGKIVSTLVEKVMMPPIGYVTGGVDFKDKAITLVQKGDLGATTDVVIGWGEFVNALIYFLIVAFCLFLVIKAMNRAIRKAPPPPPPGPTKEEALLTEIRDLLKARA